MSQRLYVLVSNESVAKDIVDSLRQKNISDDHISVVADRNKYPLDDMPEAGILERSDVLHSAQRGAVGGAAVGFLAGLGASIFAPLGIVVAGGAIAGITAGGAVLGTWLTTLVGVSVNNHDLDQFNQSIKNGSILILVDADEQTLAGFKKDINELDSAAIQKIGIVEVTQPPVDAVK